MLRWVYLILAIAGAVVPVWLFSKTTGITYANANIDLSYAKILDIWLSSQSTLATFRGLIFAQLALTLWALSEVFTRKNWLALISIPVAFLIGISCGLPLYLFFRAKPTG